MQSLYFDHNATTAVLPAILHQYSAWLQQLGNANSIHQAGQRARGELEMARDELAGYYHAGHVIFTATASEACNLAPRLWDYPAICTPIDHPAIVNNPAVKPIMAINQQGLVDLQWLAAFCHSNPPHLFIIHAAHNESGIIQDIANIAKIIKQYGGVFIVDAVQYAPKFAINMALLGVDGVVISGHKMGAGFGAAALICMNKPPINPLIYGGGQEFGYRAGTENLPAIRAMVLAQQLSWQFDWRFLQQQHQQLEDFCENLDGCIIIGRQFARLPNTTYLVHPSKRGVDLVIKADILGLAVSSGSACSSGNTKPSASLLAMGFSPEMSQHSLRISSGIGNNAAEFAQLSDILGKIW